MRLKVILTYKDDKKETFICNDNPAIGDWITLYMKDWKRITIPRDCIARIEQIFI